MSPFKDISASRSFHGILTMTRGEVWQLTRRFLAECLAAFMANIAVMFRDSSRHYETFVSGLVAGSVVYCAIFTTFVICGAQINSMTTLAVLLSRRMSVVFVPFYLTAQMIGTLLALYIGLQLSPFAANRSQAGMPMPGTGVSDVQAIGMEIIITFFLELAILGLLDELRLPSFHCMNRFNAFVLLLMVFFWIDTISVSPSKFIQGINHSNNLDSCFRQERLIIYQPKMETP